VAREQSSQSQSAKRVRGVPVTVRALSQRINRLLTAKGQELKKTRGQPAVAALGSFYILRGNSVFSDHVDLEALGRETGALADYERLLIED
jgi:hypothetical protein